MAPSALHSPIAVVWFLIKKKLRRQPLSVESLDNLKGSLASTALGTNRRKIGYYLVSATKRSTLPVRNDVTPRFCKATAKPIMSPCCSCSAMHRLMIVFASS